jgi:hypothetical protein
MAQPFGMVSEKGRDRAPEKVVNGTRLQQKFAKSIAEPMQSVARLNATGYCSKSAVLEWRSVNRSTLRSENCALARKSPEPLLGDDFSAKFNNPSATEFLRRHRPGPRAFRSRSPRPPWSAELIVFRTRLEPETRSHLLHPAGHLGRRTTVKFQSTVRVAASTQASGTGLMLAVPRVQYGSQSPSRSPWGGARCSRTPGHLEHSIY